MRQQSGKRANRDNNNPRPKMARKRRRRNQSRRRRRGGDAAVSQLEQGYGELSTALARVRTLRESVPREHRHSSLREVEERVLRECIELVTSMGAQSLLGAAPEAERCGPLVLPQHIVMSIVQFLPISSLASCILVNKTFVRACFAKGSIRHALIFDVTRERWPDVKHFQFVRSMLRDDAHKLDLIDTVQFKSFFPSIFPMLQLVRQGEQRNISIRKLRWGSRYEMILEYEDIRTLQSIYPNLTSIDLGYMNVSIPALLLHFPRLQELSVLSIRDEDIDNGRGVEPVTSLQRLKLRACDSSLTLHYICHMFPNVVDLYLENVFSLDFHSGLAISTVSSIQFRSLRELPVPPLKRLVLDGPILRDGEIYDEFLCRFETLKSISLGHMLRGTDINHYLHSIARNNPSLTEFIMPHHVTGVGIFDALHARGNALNKLSTSLACPRDVLQLCDQFKCLQHLELMISANVPLMGVDIQNIGHVIEVLTELVDLTIPSFLKVDFERLPKLRRLKLTESAPTISIQSLSLEELDIRSTSASFAKITCHNLSLFKPCKTLITLQMDTPKLEVFHPSPELFGVLVNLKTFTIQSKSLSSISLVGWRNIESCHVNIPALRHLIISWELLLSVTSDERDENIWIELKNVRTLQVEESKSIAVDESFYRVIKSFPHLEELRVVGCKFLYSNSNEESVPLSAVNASVTRLVLEKVSRYRPFARVMTCLFPNVRRFFVSQWPYETFPTEFDRLKWDRLTDLSIDTDTNLPYNLSACSVQKIFDHLLEKNVIRRLHIVLPMHDENMECYNVLLSPCSSLRELVTNVNIVTLKNDDDDDIPVLHSVKYTNLAYFNGVNRMDSEQNCREIARWLTAAFPNLESLNLVMLFSGIEEYLSMTYVLDELVGKMYALRMVQYFSSSPSLFAEFSVMREKYPQIDFSIADELQFEGHKMVRNGEWEYGF